MQAPIARRFAPNVCSALAPPGACSQAIFDVEVKLSMQYFALFLKKKISIKNI